MTRFLGVGLLLTVFLLMFLPSSLNLVSDLSLTSTSVSLSKEMSTLLSPVPSVSVSASVSSDLALRLREPFVLFQLEGGREGSCAP